VPVGKVRFYDADKGFGFLTQDEGGDVYVGASALPEDVPTLKAGARVEFGIAQGRRGDQALQVRVLEPVGSVSRAQANARRKAPDQMVVIVEDAITMLDSLGEAYRHGRHPDSKAGRTAAQLLRRLATELEA